MLLGSCVLNVKQNHFNKVYRAKKRTTPQSPQNFTPAEFSCWQRGHFTPGPLILLGRERHPA